MSLTYHVFSEGKLIIICKIYAELFGNWEFAERSIIDCARYTL